MASAIPVATMACMTATRPMWTAAARVAAPRVGLARHAPWTRIALRAFAPAPASREANHETHSSCRLDAPRPGVRNLGAGAGGLDAGSQDDPSQIGRASCRERVSL